MTTPDNPYDPRPALINSFIPEIVERRAYAKRFFVFLVLCAFFFVCRKRVAIKIIHYSTNAGKLTNRSSSFDSNKQNNNYIFIATLKPKGQAFIELYVDVLDFNFVRKTG